MNDPSATTLALMGLAAICAGWVDAVVGGGGLIQLPALLLGFPQSFSGHRHVLVAVGVGFLIGIYDGALGPGTGSFLVFALVSLLGYAFHPGRSSDVEDRSRRNRPLGIG